MNERHKIQGWFSDEEGALYRKWVQTISNGQIVEIGNYHGLSLSFIIETCGINHNTVYAIDVWHPPEFLQNMARWNALEFVKLLTMPSADAAKLFQDNSLDLVFIDGDHRFQTVSQDILAYLPKIKSGGWLAGHDYHWPEVAQAVRAILSKHVSQDNIWYYQKHEHLLTKFFL